MKENFEQKKDPLCRFGPGGDFVFDWPKVPLNFIVPQPGSLTKLLIRIADSLITKPAYNTQPAAKTNNDFLTKKTDSHENKNARTNPKPDTQTIGNTKGHFGFQSQALLFPDDSRISKPIRRKQNNNIRTHHRAAKKNNALRVVGHGTLFDVDCDIAKTA